MKRAFPQKIKSVSLPLATQEVVSEEIAQRIAETPKQTAPETHRRVRTSAAMIGLAISMGASSLLLPKQGENAMAAEPVANEPTTATTTGSGTSDVSLSASPKIEPSLPIQLGATGSGTLSGASALSGQQIVQVGQKIDLVAPETGVKSVDFARTSPIVTARLKAAGLGAAVNTSESATLNPVNLVENADDLLKAEQNQSLDQLKQKREQLRDSLTQLRPDSQTASESSTPTVRGLNFATPQSLASSEEGIAYYPLIEAVPTEGTISAAPTVTAATRLSAPQNNPLQLEAVPNSVQPELPVVPLPSSEAVSPSWQSSVTAASTTGATITNPARFGERTQVYQVKPGDTVEAIARRHGLTRSELVEANQLADPNNLSVSQVLRIPVAEFKPTAPQLVTLQPEQPATAELNSEVEESVVAEVEVPHQASVEPLAQIQPETATLMPQALPSPTAESLKTEIQNLREKYQAPEPQASTPPLPIVALEVASIAEPQVNSLPVQYRVNPGDTLDAIARRYGVSRSEIIQANQISNPNLIKVNQVLQIPNGGTSQSTAIAIPNFNRQREVSIAAAQPVAVFNSAASNSQRSFDPAPIATISPSAQSQSSPAPARVANQLATRSEEEAPRSYVEGLMNEINQMRERYQEQPTAQQPQNPASENSTSQAVNPEFSPSRAEEAEQPRSQRSQQPVAAAPATSRSTTRPSAQQVAVAPAPPASYNPALQIPYGRVVSPELPPLAPAERYLPEGAPTFDGYVWPAKGVFTSGYGWRWGRMHRGIDIAGPVGTPIVAAAGGVVDFAGWNSGGYGNLVDIRHPDGSLTRYAHNNRLLVRTGQQVEQGQQIAEMGSTGYSTGPHLHFEIHPAGQGAVNPMAFLPR